MEVLVLEVRKYDIEQWRAAEKTKWGNPNTLRLESAK